MSFEFFLNFEENIIISLLENHLFEQEELEFYKNVLIFVISGKKHQKDDITLIRLRNQASRLHINAFLIQQAFFSLFFYFVSKWISRILEFRKKS